MSDKTVNRLPAAITKKYQKKEIFNNKRASRIIGLQRRKDRYPVNDPHNEDKSKNNEKIMYYIQKYLVKKGSKVTCLFLEGTNAWTTHKAYQYGLSDHVDITIVNYTKSDCEEIQKTLAVRNEHAVVITNSIEYYITTQIDLKFDAFYLDATGTFESNRDLLQYYLKKQQSLYPGKKILVAMTFPVIRANTKEIFKSACEIIRKRGSIAYWYSAEYSRYAKSTLMLFLIFIIDLSEKGEVR